MRAASADVRTAATLSTAVTYRAHDALARSAAELIMEEEYRHHRRLEYILIAFRRQHHHHGGHMFVIGPVSIVDGTSTTAEVLGFDQYGAPFALPEGITVTYSIDTPTIATSTPNSDGVTDAVAGVGLGVAKLTATAVAGSITLTDTEAVTVTAAPSVLSSIKIAFGS
jgi:hypothetical protein